MHHAFFCCCCWLFLLCVAPGVFVFLLRVLCVGFRKSPPTDWSDTVGFVCCCALTEWKMRAKRTQTRIYSFQRALVMERRGGGWLQGRRRCRRRQDEVRFFISKLSRGTRVYIIPCAHRKRVRPNVGALLHVASISRPLRGIRPIRGPQTTTHSARIA